MKKKDWENDIIEKYNNIKTPIYIYGAGVYGAELYELLNHYNLFGGFIDNNEKIILSGYKSENVISEDDFFFNNLMNAIVIAASEKNTNIIKNSLIQRGLVYNKDFFIYDEFLQKVFPIIALKKYRQSFVNLSQICLTEKCTLKCKKCAHACYAVKKDKEDLTFQQVKNTADVFFSKVDYIQEFVLIGGEPLLYEKLPQVIEYIGSKYRNQINIFSITSNGTILPSKELINVCKKYNVLFRISNYTNSISNLEYQYNKLAKLFRDNKVQCRIGNKETTWMDYGFDYYERKCSNEELVEVFDKCNTPCHEIRENRFYYCVMARSVSDNLSYNVGEDDYLDINKLVGDNGKEEFLKYILGYSEKGYLDMCRFCHGADCKNYPIPAAEQM